MPRPNAIDSRRRAPAVLRWPAGLLAGALALAGCGSSPPATISLPGPGQAQAADGPALQTERVRYTRSQPGCSGQDCPTIDVDALRFPNDPKLTALVDEALAAMTGLDVNVRHPYRTLEEFEQYYWRTAQPRDSTTLRASLVRQTPALAVIELLSGVYTGGAHGIPATQFLNWDRQAQRVLSLDDVLEPGRKADYVKALERAHAAWLQTNEDARQDRAAYDKMWPFVPSENYALAQDGLVVKYDVYVIAPYSHGQPALTIPYEQLRGILRPAYLPG
ncbi:RsiV family protein [Orrella sp. JC864]|uniref:RsiV family protein n=1 Tax=Orrella sp. JC864 TaxID=3120298 RepID=UPI0030097EDE